MLVSVHGKMKQRKIWVYSYSRHEILVWCEQFVMHMCVSNRRLTDFPVDGQEELFQTTNSFKSGFVPQLNYCLEAFLKENAWLIA